MAIAVQSWRSPDSLTMNAAAKARALEELNCRHNYHHPRALGAPGLTSRSKELLGTKGIATKSKKLLVALGLTTSNKKATRNNGHCY